MTAAKTLGSKGRQTRQALEDAARTLFAQRGFHGTTLSDITSAAGRSTAVFYRYYADKEDLLAALAESFLSDVVQPSRKRVRLPAGPEDAGFFTDAVAAYWAMFTPNIGVMAAVDQLAATEPRFAMLRNEFRRFGIDIVGASVRCARQQGYARDVDAENTALAVALMFERFTSVWVSGGLPDAAAVTTLSTIWRRCVYGTEPKET